ncbi:uncharacterized protein LOC136772071 [Amia ocellicauda]|uniref:uncharacterized protein LOC136772071 n=1 Tax=Amia ocellicauda TaxID=2972642 RepID=UPI0034647E18
MVFVWRRLPPLRFSYGYSGSTATPSKKTAEQNVPDECVPLSWPRPSVPCVTVCLGVLNSASTVALPVLPVPSPGKGGGRTRSPRQPHLIHLKKKESLKNVSLCPGPGPLLWPCACILSLCCALSSAVSVTAGDSVTLPCDGSAHTHTVQVYWQTPGRLVCESSSGRCEARTGFEGRVEFTGAVESGDFSLTIHSTQLSDEDLYECFRVSAAGQSMFLGEVRVRVLTPQSCRVWSLTNLERNTQHSLYSTNTDQLFCVFFVVFCFSPKIVFLTH